MSFWKKKNQDSDPNSVNPSTESGPLETKAAPLAEPSQDCQNTPVQSPAFSAAEPDLSKVRSALSAGTVIQGKLSFDTPVRIDGKLSGEVYSSKVLIVGEAAQINAIIEASSLIIMGKLKGNIKASEKVHLCSGSDVEATIAAPSLIIESGAKFNGTSDMGTVSKKSQTNVFSEEKIDLEEIIDNSSQSKVAKSDNSDAVNPGVLAGLN